MIRTRLKLDVRSRRGRPKATITTRTVVSGRGWLTRLVAALASLFVFKRTRRLHWLR